MKLTIRIILFLFVIAAVALLAGNRLSRAWIPDALDGVRAARPASATLEGPAGNVCNQPMASFAAAAAAAKPAVVNVVAKRTIAIPPSLGLSPDGPDDDESSGDPGPPSTLSKKPFLERKSVGSGFAIRGDGTIVTSRLAVVNAVEVTVRFANDPGPARGSGCRDGCGDGSRTLESPGCGRDTEPFVCRVGDDEGGRLGRGHR